MTAAASLPLPAAARDRSGADWWWIAASAGVILGAHLVLALTKGINWDEFHHFDLVRQFAAGRLGSPFQTFFTRLFVWILEIPGDVTVQVRAARLVMLGCTCITAVSLYGLASRFSSRKSGAIAALAYLSGGYVLTQATSFRIDAAAAAVLTTALYLVACRPLRPTNAMLVGGLGGLAAMLTIKAVIFAPAFAALAWLRWTESRNVRECAIYLAALGAAAGVSCAALFALHSAGSIPAPIAAGGATVASAGRVLFSEGALPQGRFLVLQAAMAPFVTMLIYVAIKAAIKDAGPFRWVQFGLMLPLAVLLVYRNSYPYFFVFLLPPILAGAAPAIETLTRRVRFSTLAVLLAGLAVFLSAVEPKQSLQVQRETIAAAREIFPEPVSYFDFSGYLGADFDRALPFMTSGWGLMEYRRTGANLVIGVMERKPVPLLLINHPVLAAAFLGERPEERFLDPDAEALRTNYIPHWGRFLVAGKVIPAGRMPMNLRFMVPGPYTIEGAAVTIDGVRHSAGEVVHLVRGDHRIGGDRPTQAVLRWGDHLTVPDQPPPDGAAYDEF